LNAILHTVINNLSQAIVILNHEGVIIYSNNNVKSIVGFNSNELIGKNSFTLLYTHNLEKAKRHYDKFANHEKLVISSVLRLKDKKGQMVWTELTATNLLSDKYIKGILVTAKDITEKKKFEDQRIAQIVIETQEKERHTLAMELHDNINQMITASIFMIAEATKKLPEKNPLLSESITNLKEVVHEIRKLSSSSVTYDIENFGLKHSVTNFIKRILLSQQIRFVIKINEDAEILLTESCKLHLFRIIQEQVNNILKHASASKVLISLSKSCESLHLRIKDNGVGFDVNKPRNGIGIYNIKQRVKALNGDLHIVSENGNGTSVIIRFLP